MGKYARLTDWLANQRADRLEVSFEEIEDEDKIGVKLPPSAKVHREWWGNEVARGSSHYQCRAWRNAGWKLESLDLTRETVTFVREA